MCCFNVQYQSKTDLLPRARTLEKQKQVIVLVNLRYDWHPMVDHITGI